LWDETKLSTVGRAVKLVERTSELHVTEGLDAKLGPELIGPLLGRVGAMRDPMAATP
jgi:hypothetical protein